MPPHDEFESLLAQCPEEVRTQYAELQKQLAACGRQKARADAAKIQLSAEVDELRKQLEKKVNLHELSDEELDAVKEIRERRLREAGHDV